MGILILRSSAGAAEPPAEQIFPLEISSNGRHLQKVDGTPFLIHGDTPWSIAAQLTNAEITTYLTDRANKGFTAILINAPEKFFTSQSPTYEDVDGVAPFTDIDAFATLTSHWNRVDHIVNTAKALGIFCFLTPAYFGFAGGSQGWTEQIQNASAGELQAYGAALANRYTQGNVGWSLGGDYDGGGATLRDKQWNIVTGIRSVRTTDIIMAHNNPNEPGFAAWNGYTGWNLNTAYCYPDDGEHVYVHCANEYARSGPMPFIYMEGRYEQEDGVSAQQLRLQSWQALLSGAAGQFFGWNPGWHFESPNALFSWTGTWQENLDSTGNQQQVHVGALFRDYEQPTLVPKTDTSLVSSALGSGLSRICPALAGDATYAIILVPSSQTVTVVTNALSGVAGNVRIRLYNPTDGTYSVNQASVAKSSGQSVATGGERIIVVDAA